MHFARLLQKELHSPVLVDEPLSRHTSYRVGGPADIFVEPGDAREVQKVLQFVLEYELAYFILGSGSNVLVKDKGFRGIIIKIGDYFNNYKFMDNFSVRAGAATFLPVLVKETARQGLRGLQFASGIPGSVGGAVYMNAGAHGRDIGSVVDKVKVVSAGGEKIINSGELYFDYRYCSIQEFDGVIIEVTFGLAPGEIVSMEEEIQELSKKRKCRQPRLPSAGSVFRNPAHVSAGRLIEEAGLKGLCVGDAQISEIHANFIINLGGAKAGDILTLINTARDKVKEKFNEDLKLEIRVIGEE